MQKQEIFILLDNVRSAYNVGAIFRTAEAIGVAKIFLGGISGVEKFGSVVKLNPKVSKTALEGGSIPWEYVENPIEKLEQLKEQGVQIVSLELTPESQNFNQVNYRFPLCLVVGHEREGVSEQINKLADLKVQIPMLGQGRSLNVSIATAITLYQIRLHNLKN